MAENVLEKIIKKKSEKIVNLKKTISLDSLNELINSNKTFVNFKENRRWMTYLQHEVTKIEFQITRKT